MSSRDPAYTAVKHPNYNDVSKIKFKPDKTWENNLKNLFAWSTQQQKDAAAGGKNLTKMGLAAPINYAPPTPLKPLSSHGQLGGIAAVEQQGQNPFPAQNQGPAPGVMTRIASIFTQPQPQPAPATPQPSQPQAPPFLGPINQAILPPPGA